MRGPVRVPDDVLIAAHERKPDPAQARAVAALDRLANGFDERGFFQRLFGSKTESPAGVYLWGGVGRGKSMLMDLAFAHVEIEPKRRVDFNEFMLETHERLRAARGRSEGYPSEPGAHQIALEGQALWF